MEKKRENVRKIMRVVFMGLIALLGVVFLCYVYGSSKTNIQVTEKYKFFSTESEEEFIKFLESKNKNDIVDISCGSYSFRTSGQFTVYTVTYQESDENSSEEEYYQNVNVLATRKIEEYEAALDNNNIEIIDISVAPTSSKDEMFIITYQK